MMEQAKSIGEHLFSTYPKFSKKPIFLTRTRRCAYQEVRNASFFAYLLN